MTVILPASEVSKQLAFPLKGHEAVLELHQRALHRRLLPRAAIGWLRWVCGPLHILSSLLGSAANDPRDEDDTTGKPICHRSLSILFAPMRQVDGKAAAWRNSCRTLGER